MFTPILSDGYKFTAYFENRLIAILKRVHAITDDIVYFFDCFIFSRKALSFADMLAKNVSNTSMNISPYKVNFSPSFSMEHTKQVSALVSDKEIKRLRYLNRVRNRVRFFVLQNASKHQKRHLGFKKESF